MALLFGAPRLPSRFVTRDRINGLLAGSAALIVVRAPAGSGKTVAVADWLRTVEDVDRLWLEATDQHTFWMSFAEQLEASGVLNAKAPGTQERARRLVGRALAHLKSELLVVIDRAERIDATDAVPYLLRALAGSRRLRVVALTRRRASSEVHALQAAVDHEVITGEDLAFTRSETEALAAAHGVVASPESVATLHRVAGGAVGLIVRLLPELASGEPEIADRLERAAGEVLLQDVPDALSHPLASANIADVLSVELVRQLTGRSDARELLIEAEERGLGAWRGEDGPTDAFTLVPPVSRELWRRRPDTHPERGAQVADAVAWLAANGQGAAAVRTALRNGDLALANEVLWPDWPWLVDTPPDHAQLVALTRRFPPGELRRYPLLGMLTALGLAAGHGGRVRAAELFALADLTSRVGRRQHQAAEDFAIRALESAAARLAHRTSLSVTLAERALEASRAVPPVERPASSAAYPFLLAQVGTSLLKAGRPGDALVVFQEANRHDGPIGARFHSGALEAGTLAIVGEMPQVDPALDRLRALGAPELFADLEFATFAQLARGYQALEELDADAGGLALDPLEQHLADSEHWAEVMTLRALLAFAAHQTRAAEGVLERAASVRHPAVSAHDSGAVAAARGLLALANGHSTVAEKTLAAAPDTAAVWLARIRLELTRGDPGEANRITGRVHPADLGARQRAWALVLGAEVARRVGQFSLASSRFEHAVLLAADRRLRSPFLLMPRAELLALCELVPPASVRGGAELLAPVVSGRRTLAGR
ncbi:hypothetical protein [Cryobacterium sp. BB736]|uniref:hypothetical protein n=1 Tax=Cryobacterium sp. BB736 TaxID=2746963 RepID=UPI001874C2A2|nr:hypothetical protein [Cryobacterium sp. BB736]